MAGKAVARQRGRQAAKGVKTMGKIHGFDRKTIRKAAKAAGKRYKG